MGAGMEDGAARDAVFAGAGPREPELRAVDALIRRHAPDLAPSGAGPARMLGYGEQPYQTTAMKRPGVWPVVLLAAQKNYLSLYVAAVDDDGGYVAERYAARLGRVSCGRSCIRFRRAADLDAAALADLLTEVNTRSVSGNLTYGA